MNFLDLLTATKRNPDRMRRFARHARLDGRFKAAGIWFSLFVSTLPILRKLPLLSWLSKSASGLLMGHLSEPELVKTRNSIPQKYDLLNLTDEIFDWIIIGSGPGGAIAASKLSENDKVLVIESGNTAYVENRVQHTLQQVMEEFEKSGQEIIVANPLAQFAQARVVGGGSEINSGLYHKLPEHKIEFFSEKIGVNFLDYLKAEDKIHELLNPKLEVVDKSLSVIARGAAAQNYEYVNVPKWRTYLPNGEFEQHGMSNLVWKNKCKLENFKLLNNSVATKISIEGEIINIKVSGSLTENVFRTKKLILASGTIGTPYLLAKSGLIDWDQINFQWHPMLRVICKCDKKDLGLGDIDPFQAWTKDMVLKFGSAVSTPGLLAVGLNNVISQDQLQYLRSYYVSFASTGVGGMIRHSKTPWYKYSERDRELLDMASIELKNLIHFGGASFANPESPIKKSPSTVHIFGSLPANTDIYLKGTNQLANFPKIYICDGSLLPFGPGVNPQAIIMSTVETLFNPYNSDK